MHYYNDDYFNDYDYDYFNDYITYRLYIYIYVYSIFIYLYLFKSINQKNSLEI